MYFLIFYKIYILQAGIFHYGSISLIEEPCRSAHHAAMDIARKAGRTLSYDPNLRLPLWPSAKAAREGIMSIWDQADIIKVFAFNILVSMLWRVRDKQSIFSS